MSYRVKVRQNVSKHLKARQMYVDDDENAISIMHRTSNTNKGLRSRTSNAIMLQLVLYYIIEIH